jgi:amidase
MILQGREAWETHREWVETVNPTFGPGIAERFEMISKIPDADVARWTAWRTEFSAQLNGLIDKGAVMALPSAPCIAPFRGEPQEKLAGVRKRILMMTAAAGHAGLPQVSIPFATVDGCPVGFSIVGRRGGDEALLDLARTLGRG